MKTLRYLSPFAFICVLVALTACSGNQHHLRTSACGPTNPQPVSFDTISNSTGSSAEQSERFLVIRNEADFQTAWDELFEPNASPPLPTVDFQSDMVLIYAMGSQPNGCYSAEIESVREQGPELLVRVRELEPAPDCICTFSFVMPFSVVRVADHAGPISLCVDRQERDCS